MSDAKRLGERTLFLAHTKELVYQAKKTFSEIWTDANTGLYVAEEKDEDAYVVCGSIQNVAHKLDLQTAVEIGELVPIRCIRVKTNVDLSEVRINGIKYNSRDLESKLFVLERNKVILDTYLKFVKDKKTVVFCASVAHAKEIAELFRENGIKAEAVSGSLKDLERKRILREYECGDIDVLCACDLLNEGWDSPQTRVLFMARPTMSKTLYLQQLGRGMRLCEGKNYLMVFDFIDNSNLFNMPYSLHRIFNIKEYRPGEYVVASKNQQQMDIDLIAKGEKPSVYLDFPIDLADYELIELFNWQEEAKNMVFKIYRILIQLVRFKINDIIRIM